MASPFIVRKAACFGFTLPNRPGQAARLLNGIAAHAVNLMAFTSSVRGARAHLAFMPHNPKKFAEAARKLGHRVGKPDTVFLVTGRDRAGVVGAVSSKLADAGVDVVAMEAVTSGAGRFGAVFRVRRAEIPRASRVLNVK